MIPRTDAEIRWDVNYTVLRPISEDDIVYGGFATRGFAAVLVATATWDDAAETLARERKIVERLASMVDNPETFDQLAGAEEEGVILWDPDEGPVPAPEIGVFAASQALCAAGCVTAASCRGHPGPHAWSEEPVILLTADPIRARVIEEVARSTGCGLLTTDNDRLRLYAQSIEEILGFAAGVIDCRSRFDALPLSEVLNQARGTGPPVSEPQRGEDSLF